MLEPAPEAFLPSAYPTKTHHDGVSDGDEDQNLYILRGFGHARSRRAQKRLTCRYSQTQTGVSEFLHTQSSTQKKRRPRTGRDETDCMVLYRLFCIDGCIIDSMFRVLCIGF